VQFLFYCDTIITILYASLSKCGPYSEDMTAETGRKESRLFLDSYSAPRLSLEIDTDRSALCCGGGAPNQGTPPSFKNALRCCTHFARLLCAQSRRASKNATQPSNKGILLVASGFPAAFAQRPPGCKFAPPARSSGCQGCEAVSAFDLSTRQKGPQNGRGRDNLATGIPWGRAKGRQDGAIQYSRGPSTLSDPTKRFQMVWRSGFFVTGRMGKREAKAALDRVKSHARGHFDSDSETSFWSRWTSYQ
jgi:hypothetical protein